VPAEFAAVLRRDQMAWIDRGDPMLNEEESEPLAATAGLLTSAGSLAPLNLGLQAARRTRLEAHHPAQLRRRDSDEYSVEWIEPHDHGVAPRP
jgi:hypothetical protein